MLILLKNTALISGLSKDQITTIKKHLTIDNPLFFKRVELGLSNWGTVSQLNYYEVIGETSVEIPIGALQDILSKLTVSGAEISLEDIIDNRVSNRKDEIFSNIKFTGTLRDYQKDILDVCMQKTIGVVEAMTGSGKTIAFVALTVKRKEPTLILVNTIELANQTIASFEKFTNLTKDDIGFIGAGQFELKPITVGLHQTLAKLPPKTFEVINERIGQVIGDEIHIIAAETWYKTMSNLRAKYKFGFSATPKRDDGLTAVIHFASGPKIYTVPSVKLKNVLIKPTFQQVETDYSFPLINTQEYGEMIGDLSIDKDRNDLILNTLRATYKNKHICLLCGRLSQVDYLQQEIGDKAVSLTSKMSKKERALKMSQLQAGKKRIVVSTYGLFSTGIDLPQLEVLMLCAPMKSEVKLRQAAGRLMRKSKGKKSAIIVDFVDIRVDILKWQSRHRRKILTNL